MLSEAEKQTLRSQYLRLLIEKAKTATATDNALYDRIERLLFDKPSGE